MNELAAPPEDVLILAENLSDVQERFDAVEARFASQARTIDAASKALDAAVQGIRTLGFEVLDRNIATLAAQFEAHRIASDAKLAELSAQIAELKAQSKS